MIGWLLTMLGLAWRNILRQARRSTLTSAAMVLGVGLLMMSRTLADGAHEDWIEAGARMGSGHLTIQHPRFQTSRKLEHRLAPDAHSAATQALQRPAVAQHVVAVSPRLNVSGLASSPSAARPVEIVGVDPEREASFTTLDEKTMDGRYLQPDDRLSAYVGQELADRLELELGARLVLTAQDAAGEISGQLVRVTGIFRTGIPEVDQSVIHVPLSTARGWLGTGDAVTSIAIVLDSSFEVADIQRAVERALADEIAAGALAVLDWQEAMPQLAAGVRIDDYGDYVMHIILLAIVALAIVNTVLMSVLYRTREFGLLQAMGLTPGETAGLVMIEGAMLTAISGVVGVALGLSVTWLLWRDGLDLSGMWDTETSFSGVIIEPVMVPIFRIDQVILGFVFIAIIGLLASLYPAYRATRIDVAHAMKFER